MIKTHPQELAAISPYVAEYMAAIDRTERMGFKAPPRIRVRNDCVDMSVVMPLLLDFYEANSPEDWTGQNLAIHFDLIPRIYEATNIPLFLTVGWMVWDGNPIYPHDEALIRRFIAGGSEVWVKEGCPFHLWMTSPAFEILDITFAMNLGHARTREQCAQKIIYQPAHAPAEDRIYHPTVVGPDFFYKTGAIL